MSLEEKYTKESVLEAYNAIKEHKIEIMHLQVDKKGVEDSIREKIAEKEGLEDKEGKPDVKKIKAGLVKKALETHLTGENKLAKDLETMETYLTYLKNKDVPKSQIDRYTILDTEEKDAKSELSSTMKNIKTTMDEDVLKAILEIVNNEIAKEKNDLENKELDPEKQAKKETSFLQKFYGMVGEIKKLIKS